MELLNNNIIIDPLYIRAAKGSGIINPGTGRETATGAGQKEHPFKAVVKFAPKYIYNGGIRYESELRVGDVVVLQESEVVGKHFPPYIEDGYFYPIIKYATVIAFYTPTEEEKETFVFMRSMDDEHYKAIAN